VRVATRRSVGTAAIAAVTLLSTGGATAFLLRPAAAPAELRSATEVTAAPVGREELGDERTVKISLRRTAAPPLLIGFAGRVIATSCRPGEALTSGRAVARINDVPLIALATSAPLYRNLSSGSEGADVAALQRELARLGYAVTVTGEYGARTAAAVKKLKKASGVAKPSGSVDFGQILWLPAPSVVPDSCELAPGQYVSAGHTYAKVPARLVAVAVESKPPNAVAGARVITVMGVTGPLGKDGVTATDPALLRGIAATQEYRMLVASEKDEDLSAVVTLKDPLPALKVPPGALFAVDRDRGCVQSGEKAYPVKIVGSRLGATLVTMAGEAPRTVNLGRSLTAESCS